jgi:hypothetical protein
MHKWPLLRNKREKESKKIKGHGGDKGGRERYDIN